MGGTVLGKETSVEAGEQVLHYMPEQPGSVPELTARLFPAYRVEGGRVYLAGCQWEDRLFLRVRVQRNGWTEEIWTDDHGRPLPPELVQQLGLAEAKPITVPPPYAPARFQRALEQARERAAAVFGQGGEVSVEEIAAVWCKFVEGKLRLTIGSASVDLPFSGWARSVQAPPFICPHTGRATFHVAAADDGKILDASAVAHCEVSGRRLPVDELLRCSWTGKRADKRLMGFCSLSGQPVLQAELLSCSVCQQKVSAAVLSGGVCSACRGLQTVSKADPRMARLLAEYPLLDRWRRWQLAETETVYILTAFGLWKKLLVVADKETLEFRHMATGNRLQTRWQPVEPGQYSFVLRE